MCNTVGNTVCCLGAGVIGTTQTPPHVKRILIKGDRFQNNRTANDVIRNSRCFQNLHKSDAEKKYLGYKRFEILYLQSGIAFTCCAISLKTIDLF